MSDFAAGYGPLTYQGVKAEVSIHMAAAQAPQRASEVADKVSRITGTQMGDMSGLTRQGRRLQEQVRRALNELADSGMLSKSRGYSRGRENTYITHTRLEALEAERTAERERLGVGHTGIVSSWTGKVVGRGSGHVTLQYSLPKGGTTQVRMPDDLVTITKEKT